MPAADANNTSGNQSSGSSLEEELAYYKSQYEQLEAELADFQASSRELEAELEKDIEASEKRERQLKSQVESLTYEVEEWKSKYKQAKAEASAQQNSLQKEITSLREANRTLQLKIRDIEVINDDYERQARNTTSSLEDLESKYNVAIERGVLLEEEIKNSEQEREALRIDAQRLRTELSDLKIENEIIAEKLRKAEAELQRRRLPYLEHTSSQDTESSQLSPTTASASSTLATPPAKSVSSATSESITPPSPTPSECSVGVSKSGQDRPTSRPRGSISSNGGQSSYARHTRTPSIPRGANGSTTSRTNGSRLPSANVPRSGSLYQIRGLIGKMQKLEERVQSARSRLPAPSERVNGTSPRTPSTFSASTSTSIPTTVTIRTRRRVSGGSVSSSARDDDASVASSIPQSRVSYNRPPDSRPSSRASVSSRSSIGHSSIASSVTSGIPVPRSESQQSHSLNGSRTPLGHYSTNPMTESRRPPSVTKPSFSQSIGPGSSVSVLRRDSASKIASPPSRRGTGDQEKFMRTSIPTPGTLKRRPGGSLGSPGMAGQRSGLGSPRRISTGIERPRLSDARTAHERKKKYSDLGETY